MASKFSENLEDSNTVNIEQDIQPYLSPNISKKKGKKLAQSFSGNSSLLSKPEQLEYLDQCLVWCKKDDRGLLAVKFRDHPQFINNIIAQPLLDLEVSKKMLQIFTSNIVIKPTKSSKEIFKRILISLFDNNFFEPNGPISSLIENTFYNLSSLKTKENKEFKRELETLSEITNFFEVLINKLPDRQCLLLTCITQLLSSSQDVKIIPKELKDKIKHLSTLMDKFKCTESDASTSKTQNRNIQKSETKKQINMDKSSKHQVSKEQMKVSCNDNAMDKQDRISISNKTEQEITIESSPVISKSFSPSRECKRTHSPSSHLTLKLHILPRTRSDLAPRKYKPSYESPLSYSSPAIYFQSMFQDLREEALFPMRRTIRRYFSKRSDPKFENSLFVYENVRFENISCSEKEGVIFSISFTPIGIPDSSSYRWGNSSRLRYGSLLFIFTKRRSGKYFDKIYFATVARRDARVLSKRLSVSIHFENAIPSGFDPRLEYFMIESKHYRFFHLHQCLSALKTMDPKAIPLTNVLLPQPPTSTKQHSFLDRAKGVDACDLNQSKIDSSLKAAMTFALSNQVSLFQTSTVVQGSISQTLVRTLILNRLKLEQSLPITPTHHVDETITLGYLREFCRRQAVGLDFDFYANLCFSPILVIHQDRESMDLFLNSLLDVDNNFVRLYSRNSPHTRLAKRSFYEVSKVRFNMYDLPPEIRKFKSDLFEHKKELSEKRQLFRQYSRGYFDCSFLTQSDVKHLASPEHYESLFNSKSSFSKPPNTQTIEHWLLNDNPSSHHFEPSRDFTTKSQDCHITYQETTDDTNGYYSDDNLNEIYEDFPSNSEVAYCNYDRDGIGGMDLSNYEDSSSEFDELEQSDSEDGDLDLEFFDEIIQENSDSGKLNLDSKNDVWEMEFSERNDLYDQWESKHRIKLLENISTISKEIEALINQINYTRVQMDIFVLKNSSLISTTPEEAIKFHLQLRGVKPRIVIVHDSCSLRESELLPLFADSLKHLILFHDQDQLTATSKYMANIRGKSLFQRLVKIGYEPFLYSPKLTLRPEIASLTRPYRHTESNPDLPNVRGVAKNVFFLSTLSPEQSSHGKSGTEYTNEQEASFLVQFAKYLLKQGYAENEICLATIYPAQVKLICFLLAKAKLGDQMDVSLLTSSSTIRSKIALISLVRSNRANDIGFLSNSDLVYAAFTSASEGLYVVGDADCIRASNRRPIVWDIILDELRDNVGKKLPLSCQTHHNITLVAKDKDFRKARNGGCLTPCNFELKCGHRCLQICHPDPHVGSECLQSCGTGHGKDSQHVSVDMHLLKQDDSDNVTPIEAASVNCESLW